MTSRSQRTALRLSHVVLVSVMLSSCGNAQSGSLVSPPSPTPTATPPAEFAAACGKPGAVVEVKRVPVTITRASCDLTGVIVNHEGVGVTVPPEGGASVHADGPTGGSELSASVDPKTQDVTIQG